LEAVLAGRPCPTRIGETYLVEGRYSPDYTHGRCGLLTQASLRVLAAWAGEERLGECLPQSFAFLDTETTGLGMGAGTYAFLIGIGRFEGDEFHLAQFFMRDPLEEPAQLAALEEFLAPCQALVTFNGKSFDVPILNARFTLHGWRSPFADTAHIDLLHLARRLWRDRLPSRTLGNLEVQILRTSRTEEDVPGWMIPQLYIDYLRSGDAQPLKSVFYHNAMDILSLAALFNHTASLLADPFAGPVEHGLDLIALGRLFEDLEEPKSAARLYGAALEAELPAGAQAEAAMRLALLHKRLGELETARPLWERAARLGHYEAYLELAKYFEHHRRDFRYAIVCTEGAAELVRTSALPAYERRQRLVELNHRLERLERKLLRGEPPQNASR
jgi:uncharacterized protein YprB with RNaseH-like and TPR domain